MTKNKIRKQHLLRQLSCAQAAKEAASLGMIALSRVISSLKSRRQVTRSIEGRDRMVRSDNMSRGAAAGMIGYTVKSQPQPLTDPSLVNFQRSSSPGTRNSCDQSDHSRPARHDKTFKWQTNFS